MEPKATATPPTTPEKSWCHLNYVPRCRARRLGIRLTLWLAIAGMLTPAFAGEREVREALEKRDYKRAAQEALILLRQGDAFGTCVYGQLAANGDGIARDPELARQHLPACSGWHHPGTQRYAELLLETGKTADSIRAREIIEGLLPHDKTGSYHYSYARWLAQYWDGAPRPSNRRQVLEGVVEKAVKLGNTDVKYGLGLLQNWSADERVNDPKLQRALKQDAIEWFRRGAAEDNSKDAMKKYLELTGWMKTSADRDELEKLLTFVGAHAGAGVLAMEYIEGKTVPRNANEARFWAEAAAKRDNAWGLYVLGQLHTRGEAGLKASGREAISYLSRAFNQGAWGAAARLADIYSDAKLVPQNLGLARGWLEKGYAASPSPYQERYADTLSYFDSLQAQANDWAKQRSQQKGWTGEDVLSAGLAVFAAAIAIGMVNSRSQAGSGQYVAPLEPNDGKVQHGFIRVDPVQQMKDHFEFFDSVKF